LTNASRCAHSVPWPSFLPSSSTSTCAN
jgi:hypothetical protein